MTCRSQYPRGPAGGGTRWPVAVKDTLTALGTLFVKLGQNLANRPDLVEESLMEAGCG